MEYTEENNIDRILFSADFEKALDSAENSFILATLESFGFGPHFIDGVRVILNDAKVALRIKDTQLDMLLRKEDADKVTLSPHTFS